MIETETQTIEAVLADPGVRGAFLRDAEALLGRRVAESRGLTGMAVRAGYAAFQRVQPGIVGAALERLVPIFAPALEQPWSQAKASGDPRLWFTSHASAIASDLLAITDQLARRADNAVLTSIYRSLRGRAQQEVAAAMPDVAGLLQRHIG